MPIDRQKKIIFIHIPKTGGTSVAKTLGICSHWEQENINVLYGLEKNNNIVLQSLALKFYDKYIPEQFIKECKIFTVVRNPYDRVLSDYTWNNRSYKTMEKYLLYIKDELSKKTDYELMIFNRHKLHNHILPQYKYIESDKYAVSFIIRFENIKNEFKKNFPEHNLIHTNKSKHVSFEKYFKDKPKCVSLINEIYSEDFKKFGYKKYDLSSYDNGNLNIIKNSINNKKHTLYIFQHQSQKVYSITLYMLSRVYKNYFDMNGFNTINVDGNTVKNINDNNSYFLVDSTQLMNNQHYFELNCKIICINIEPLYDKERWGFLLSILKKCWYVIDYTPTNINILRDSGYTNTFFLPPSYNTYYNNLYNQFKIFVEKKYDVLFYGGLTPRRKVLLNNLKKKGFIVQYKRYKSIKEQTEDIIASKIVICPYFSDNYKEFDFYRCTYLIANNVLVLSESVSDENNLRNIRSNLLMVKYDNFIPKITKLLELSQKDRDEMASKHCQYIMNNWNMYDFKIPNKMFQ